MGLRGADDVAGPDGENHAAEGDRGDDEPQDPSCRTRREDMGVMRLLELI
jgi:hypothetical protein